MRRRGQTSMIASTSTSAPASVPAPALVHGEPLSLGGPRGIALGRRGWRYGGGAPGLGGRHVRSAARRDEQVLVGIVALHGDGRRGVVIHIGPAGYMLGMDAPQAPMARRRRKQPGGTWWNRRLHGRVVQPHARLLNTVHHQFSARYSNLYDLFARSSISYIISCYTSIPCMISKPSLI